MENKKLTLYILVPCYNEEEVLVGSSSLLVNKIESLIKEEKISNESKAVFIDDGSRDKTQEIITNEIKNSKHAGGIKLSRNCGHQNALLAGLEYAAENADISISIDADLQDDTNAIDQMVDKANEGADIVYGVRSTRKKDSFFKRVTAEGYYKVLSGMGVKTIYNHADFRLMSKRAMQALMQYNEVNVYLRGLVPMLGFKEDYVYYERKKREAGVSKYPLNKMIGLAVEGITSLSIKPIKMIMTAGIILSIAAFIGLIYILICAGKGTVPGWSSLICVTLLMNGIQLFSIGIIGEYIGKIYLETKKRPRYIVEKTL